MENIEKQEYPKWIYKTNELPVVVESVEEKNNMGEGWVESPASEVEQGEV